MGRCSHQSAIANVHEVPPAAILNRSRWTVEELRGQSLNADVAKNLDEQVSLADIIITTTPATSALFGDNLVRPGTHITAIGADRNDLYGLNADLLGHV